MEKLGEYVKRENERARKLLRDGEDAVSPGEWKQKREDAERGDQPGRALQRAEPETEAKNKDGTTLYRASRRADGSRKIGLKDGGLVSHMHLLNSHKGKKGR